ncbi:InlB B-repeat-containing protein [Bifidobacterium miconisargentati]|uniref:InlB B-repeat-containing protein n=1 Tax=Bifidobacterium miconisargentati TaxID=2834437 RepID=UPI001BDC0EAF|nr:InlB B-repeat-containing protein [Bifidobacterium miconisargentati]MBW3091157.1 InlB B-repeat-containing protein [Bifidobacterium miconisargentati]
MTSRRTLYAAVSLIAAAAMMFAGAPASYAADEIGFNHSIETATSVQPNTAVSGMAGLTAQYYKFTLPSAGYIQLKMTNTQGNDLSKWNVQIEDSAGKAIATEVWNADVLSHEGSRVGLGAGEYYASVTPMAAIGLKYELNIGYTVSDSWESEPNNDMTGADAIAIGRTVNGTFTKTLLSNDNPNLIDDDWYRFTMPADGRVAISMTNDQRDLAALNVSLLNNKGDQIMPYPWIASVTQHKAESVGLAKDTYYIKVSGASEGLKYALTVDNAPVSTATVTFDTQGGSKVDAQTVAKGSTVSRPADPTKSGYAFAGWYTKASGGQAFDFDSPIRRDITVYAHWNKTSTKYTFVDVNDLTPHHDDIQWLADTGISTGWNTSKGKEFRGMNTVVRQDMAAFLYRLAGSPTFDVSKAKNPFADVTEKTSHYKEILWLADTGIAKGYVAANGTVTFGGMTPVYRQDMAAFLHRLADYQQANPQLSGNVEFVDVNEKTPHYQDIEWLARTGVSTGWNEDDGAKFHGERYVVRQDMAAFLHRMYSQVLN